MRGCTQKYSRLNESVNGSVTNEYIKNVRFAERNA